MGKKISKKTLKDLEPDDIKVFSNAVNYLFDNKTPKYADRFQSWAHSTQGEHLDNLVDALLSTIAHNMITGATSGTCPNPSVDYLRGMAQGVLVVKEHIRSNAAPHKSSKKSKTEGGEEDSVTTVEYDDDVISLGD